jgi:hypothetical protein
MIRVADDDAVHDGQPGSFCIETLEWDGNMDKPTLAPSVHLPGRWHGWFRAGRVVSC